MSLEATLGTVLATSIGSPGLWSVWSVVAAGIVAGIIVTHFNAKTKAKAERARSVEIWAELRTHERPILAFLKHVTSTPDPQAEVTRLVAALSPEEATAILPEIERERARGDAWRAKNDAA